LRRRWKAAGKSLDPLEPSRAGYGEIVSVRQQRPLGLGHACGARVTSLAMSHSRSYCLTI
jgi:UTP-glucose-1-phosphate uridylyltransferase